jgi:hypothetical protein
MTVKAALAGAGIAALSFTLTGTVSSATEFLPGLVALFDNREGELTGSLRQDSRVSDVEEDTSALSGQGGDTLGAFGDREEASTFVQPGSFRNDGVDVPSTLGVSANQVAFGADVVADSSASGRAAYSAAVTPDSVVGGAAPSALAQMMARIIEFSANATASAPRR